MKADESVLKSLFEDYKGFINQLREADLYRDGYMCRQASMEDLMKGKINSIPWYECWVIENVDFLGKLRAFERDFSYSFNAKLFSLTNNLSTKLEPLNHLCNMFRPSVGGVEFTQIGYKVPNEVLLEAYKVEEVLLALREFMEYVQEISGIDILSITLRELSNNGTAPNVGDALAL